MSVSSLENPHLESLISLFGAIDPEPSFSCPELDYLFILYTNRSGSNLLAQILASTGYLNEAGEFFNADTVAAHARANNLGSLQAYFRYLSSLVARNGRVTAKLAVEHVALLAAAGILNPVLSRSRFILIERHDRLGQAISRVIASQNQRWTSEHPARIPDDRLTYARGRIDDELARITCGNGIFYRFLAFIGATPLHTTYEALVAAPQSVLDAAAEMIGLPKLSLDLARIRIKKQANAVNESWRERYLAGC